MPKTRSRQIPHLKRGASKRQPKRKFILICEGKKTEPDYFTALRRTFSDTLIEIELIGGVGVPATIANKAVEEINVRKLTKRNRKKLNSFEQADEVWAIFDRDEHPSFEESVQRCSANGIGVARSNPCFEVWLILHFEDFDQSIDRHAVQRHFGSCCSDYDQKNNKTTDCNALMSSVCDAETRAKRQLENRLKEGDSFGAPSTTVFELVGAIRLAAKDAK